MPLMQTRVSVPASSTVENVLSGLQFEYLPRPSMLEIALVAASGNPGDLTVDVSIGDVGLLAENVPVGKISSVVTIPDDLYINEAAPAGSRLKIRARNSTGGAIILTAWVRVTFLR